MPALLLRLWKPAALLLFAVACFAGGWRWGSRPESAPGAVSATETVQERSQAVESVTAAKVETGRRDVTRTAQRVRERFRADGSLEERSVTTTGAVEATTSTSSAALEGKRAELTEASRETHVQTAPAPAWRVSALVGVQAAWDAYDRNLALRVGAQLQRDFAVPIPLLGDLPATAGLQVLVTPDLRQPRPEVIGAVGVRW